MGLLEQFTNREKEIVTELALGYTEKEVASRLFVSTVTVHNHTYNMRKKTNSRSNLEMVVKFILTIENPKKLLAALLFVIIQFSLVFNEPNYDLLKNQRPNRAYVRVSRKNNEI